MIKYKHRANNIEYIKHNQGLEIDVFANNGELVIGHDYSKPIMTLDNYLKKCVRNDLAVNVKQSGLSKPLYSMLKYYYDKKKIKSFFMFDMSTPDLFEYMDLCPQHTAFRLSEYEYVMYTDCKYVWLDFFDADDTAMICMDNVEEKYKIVVVSPELHNNNFKYPLNILHKFYGVCTDD